MFRDVVAGFQTSIFMSVLIFLLVIVPLYMFGPIFEGKYAPVYENVTIFRKMHLTPDQATFTMELDKVRECEIIKDGVQWYVRTFDGESHRVAIQILNRSNEGDKYFANFTVKYGDIDISREYIQEFVLINDCHPLWLTKTIISIP